MSRTKRNIPFKILRHPKTKQTQILEIKACSEIFEYFGRVSNRLVARANPRSGSLANTLDDINFSSYREMKYSR